MQRSSHRRVAVLIILLGLMGAAVSKSRAQSRRQIKVVLETKQSGTSNQDNLQGSGSVVIRHGTVNPSGKIIANERQTSIQRSGSIFTLVLDGGESVLSVANRVPQSQIAYFYDYAARVGYIEQRIVFNDVGTFLRVSAATLSDGEIRLRLTPRISYFSAERPGAIDFTEAAAELIVCNGQPVSLGGSTTTLHEITRHILGYRERTSSSEISLVVTATLQ